MDAGVYSELGVLRDGPVILNAAQQLNKRTAISFPCYATGYLNY